ncbi:MAG: transglycosylase domain-containing protein [Caldilineaceae bacterium]
MLGAAALYFTLLADLPAISTVQQRLIRPTTQILDRNGRLLYEVIDPDAGKQVNLDLTNFPKACIDATLATEDKRFFLHPGVDPVAIARALIQNWRGREVVSGGSTLTQQLARNLFLSPEERYTQSLSRKIREGWLAWRLERVYTKEQVLALYLNQTYYGNFAFGLEAAAQVFFAKPAAQLSRAECTLLAGLVQYPTGYNPLLEPETAKARQLTVLRLMREADFITQAESDEIAAEPLRYKSKLFDIEAPHFVMYVQDLLLQQVGADRLRQGGLHVVTTLDLDLQHKAEQSVRYRLDLLNCRKPGLCNASTDPNRRVDNAAVVVLDARTGEILAMVGSPDYFDQHIQGNVNAALSLRQPGSAIKPLTYAVALDPQWNQRLGLSPLTPATIIPDLETTFYVKDENGGNVPYQPVNYDRQYHGPVSIRSALANSYNIPAVKTLDRIGVASLQQLAADAGISTFGGDFGLALTLGGGEVKLLELTAAYGIFQQGKRLEPRAIEEIGGWGDEEKVQSPYLPTSPSPQFISPQTAYLLTDMLSDNVARIPSFGENSVLHLPFPAAAKTGTTTDYRDNWTVGYSTERIVGVWVGNADNTAMLDISGVDGAGPIWHDVMLAAHPNFQIQPPRPFNRPDGIVDVTICAASGMLPSPACPRTITEHFIRGTEPTQPDTQFVKIAIDRTTGLRATEATPKAQILNKVYWNLPPEYQPWMLSQGIALIPNSELPITNYQTASTTLFNPQSAIPKPQLLLTAPTSHTSYRIRPDLPRANQRLQIGGYVTDGSVWYELRLMLDGQIVQQKQSTNRLTDWWVLEPGEHHFWIEGTEQAGGEIVKSDEALVIVE